jgi:hypothetical protein
VVGERFTGRTPDGNAFLDSTDDVDGTFCVLYGACGSLRLLVLPVVACLSRSVESKDRNESMLLGGIWGDDDVESE